MHARIVAGEPAVPTDSDANTSWFRLRARRRLPVVVYEPANQGHAPRACYGRDDGLRQAIVFDRLKESLASAVQVGPGFRMPVVHEDVVTVT